MALRFGRLLIYFDYEKLNYGVLFFLNIYHNITYIL